MNTKKEGDFQGQGQNHIGETTVKTVIKNTKNLITEFTNFKEDL